MEIQTLTDLSPSNLNFFPKMPTLFQALDGAAPVGSLTVFAPTARTAELTAAVIPSKRHQGVFRALLNTATRNLKGLGYQELLFVCSSDNAEAQAVAAHWGLSLEHSEYLMDWSGDIPACPRALLSHAVREEDISALSILCADAFGETPEESEHLFRQDLSTGRFFPLEKGLSACASCREGEGGLSIYGVVVPPSLRGQGWGKALMAALLKEISETFPGRPVVLEVSSTNLPALALYRSCGFTVRRRTDYYSQSL